MRGIISNSHWQGILTHGVLPQRSYRLLLFFTGDLYHPMLYSRLYFQADSNRLPRTDIIHISRGNGRQHVLHRQRNVNNYILRSDRMRRRNSRSTIFQPLFPKYDPHHTESLPICKVHHLFANIVWLCFISWSSRHLASLWGEDIMGRDVNDMWHTPAILSCPSIRITHFPWLLFINHKSLLITVTHFRVNECDPWGERSRVVV